MHIKMTRRGATVPKADAPREARLADSNGLTPPPSTAQTSAWCRDPSSSSLTTLPHVPPLPQAPQS